MKKIFTFLSVLLATSGLFAQINNVYECGAQGVSSSGSCDAYLYLCVDGIGEPYTYNWSDTTLTSGYRDQLCEGTYTILVTDSLGATFNYTYVVTVAPPSVNTYMSPYISSAGMCDGTATLNVTGGVTPYTYSWAHDGLNNTNTASGLCEGLYYYTVMDAISNSVSGVINGTIQPDSAHVVINISGLDTTFSCTDGDMGYVDLYAEGGIVAANYAYLWSNGSTSSSIYPSVGGVYTITVTDDSLQTAVRSFNLIDPRTPAIVNFQLVQYADSNIVVTGGTAYVINPELNWSNPDTLAVLTPDASGMFSYSDMSSTAPSIYYVPDTSLFPGAIPTYYKHYRSPYAYIHDSLNLWGMTVCQTDSIKMFVLTAADTVPPCNLAVTLSATNVSVNGGFDGSITSTVTGGIPSYLYQWNDFSTLSSLDSVPAGSYSLTVTDANGCTASASAIVNEPAAATCTLSVALTATNETSAGAGDGSVTSTVTGNVGSVTYSWNTGATTANLPQAIAGTYSLQVADSVGCIATATAVVGTDSSACTLAVALTATNETSAGAGDGSVTSTVTGNAGVVTYIWNTGATTSNLPQALAGTYSLTVTDSTGCVTNATATVGTDSLACPLSVALTATNETSAGAGNGSVTSTVTGNTGVVTYIWNTGATTSNLPQALAGTYSLTVTDTTGCVANATATVGTDSTTVTPQPMAVVATKTNTTCAGVCDGTATLTVSGGTTPYSFAWSNGASAVTTANLCDGTYAYTVTDAAGKTRLGYVNILDGAALSVALDSISGITSATCGSADGAAAVVPVGGTAPYTYAWAGGQNTASISNVSAGLYSVVVTDAAGCQAPFSLVVPDISGPSVIVASSTTANCGGKDGKIMINVSGGAAPYQYLWANGVTAQNLLDAASGVHYVEVTDANGCVGSASAYIQSTGNNAPTIFGNVLSQAGGNIVSGNVVIYADAPYTTQMDTLASAPIDNEGNFYFSSILPVGDYILQVLPDVSQHPNAIPTYNGLTNRWDSAMVVTLGCDQNFNVTITTFDLAPLGGLSDFNGTIISDGTGGRRAGDPIPGIDVSLEQIPGGIVAFTETDANGKFAFANVPTGLGEVYEIHVDIPGLDNATTYTINASSTDTTASALDFVVGNGQINAVTSTGISQLQSKNNVKMYPNPSNGNIFFNVSLENDKMVSYKVVNLIGEEVMQHQVGTMSQGNNTFEIKGLSPGAYIITVTSGNEQSTFKALVIE